MEHVSLNDGLDGRETVAFGLGAAEVAAFVLSLLGGYAVLRSGLAGAVAWAGAAVLAGGGAALAWGRQGGRSLLEWSVLAARFMVRTRLAGSPAGSQTGAVVVPLALRRHPAPRLVTAAASAPAPAPAPVRRGPLPRAGARLETFFSLNGGSGRTTLAVEVAARLAIGGAAERAAGGAAGRVALVDLAIRSPAVALRLGLPLPGDAGGGGPAGAAAVPLVEHAGGLMVFCGPVPCLPAGAAAAWVDDVVEAVAAAGAAIVIADVDGDLGELGVAVLRRCHRVHVTVTPSAGGVLDAYRSTAVLRRLGLRDRIDYVANRCRGPAGLAEVMGDLGGSVIAEIPEDAAFLDAENGHRPAAFRSGGPAAAAIARLASRVGAVAGADDDLGAAGSRAG